MIHLFGLCAVLWHLSVGALQSDTVDITQKIAAATALTQQAVKFFTNTPVHLACRAFSREKRWRQGEMQVFVFDEGGTCYVFGNETTSIWHDYQTKKTATENDFISQMLTAGQGDGGGVDFTWNNIYMHAIVKNTYRNGKLYIIGCGFYPASAAYLCKELVTSAVQYAASHPFDRLCERIGSALGLFIRGDMYLAVYDFHGICAAHGKSLELIGQNLFNERSEDGILIIQESIKIASSDEGSGWLEFQSKEGGVTQRIFAHKLVSSEGKRYVIIGGFYPTITEADVRTVVKRAVSYMRTHGSTQAFAAFSQPRGPFAYGGITLFAYDTSGTVKADMQNPAFVGQNLLHSVDKDGRLVTRIIIDQAKKYGSGWLSFNLKNAFTMIYVERITLPEGTFIVGASFYPIGKQVTTRFMVEKASRYLEQVPTEVAFDLFSSSHSDYLRGDIAIQVFDETGILLVCGPDKDKIWSKGLQQTDKKGVPVIKKVIELAKSGGGWLTFAHNNGTKKVYAKQVIKNYQHTKKYDGTNGTETPVIPESFIVVAGYYL